MANIYCTATNTGKGFVTYQDRMNFYVSGHSGDVWVVGDTEKGALWVSRNSGTPKTTAEAQAIVDGKMEEAQVVYDGESADYKSKNAKPEKYILP